jgi:hypothetical protein
VTRVATDGRAVFHNTHPDTRPPDVSRDLHHTARGQATCRATNTLLQTCSLVTHLKPQTLTVQTHVSPPAGWSSGGSSHCNTNTTLTPGEDVPVLAPDSPTNDLTTACFQIAATGRTAGTLCHSCANTRLISRPPPQFTRHEGRGKRTFQIQIQPLSPWSFIRQRFKCMRQNGWVNRCN